MSLIIKNLNPKFLKLIRNAIHKFIQKKNKMDNYRKNILLQWISTQKTYVQDLKIYIQYVAKPCLQLMSKNDHDIIFSNIQSIYQLNSKFLEEMQDSVYNFDPQKTQISKTLQRYNHFFKLYSEYCNKYYQGDRLLKNLMKNNLFLKTFIKKVFKENQFRNQQIQSFRIKPVQRLPKYVLLLSDYIKHMPKNHIEYNQIKNCYNLYHDVNNINNMSMQREIKNRQIFNLNSKFGTPQNPLINAKRKFFFKFKINLFNKKKENVQFYLYIFSDLLLFTIVKKKVEKKLKLLELDENSFVEDIECCKYFKNILLISGKNFCQTIFMERAIQKIQVISILNQIISELIETSESKKKLINNNTKELKTVDQKSKQQENNYNNILCKTRCIIRSGEKNFRDPSVNIIFAIEYKLMNDKIFRVFFEMNNFQSRLKDIIYTCNLNYILQTKQNKCNIIKFSQQKTEYIQTKKLLLQQIVNQIFKTDNLIINFEYVGYKLGFDCYTMNFINCIMYEKETKQYLQKTEQKLNLYNNMKRMMNLKGCQLLEWMNLKMKRLEHSKIHPIHKSQFQFFKVEIELRNIFSNQNTLQIFVVEQHRIQQIIVIINQQLQLGICYDYALFYENRKGQRKLDNDEKIGDIIKNANNVKSKQIRLIFKKWIYLMPMFQNQLFSNLNKENKEARFLSYINQLYYRLKIGDIQFNNLKNYQLAIAYIMIVKHKKFMFTQIYDIPISIVKETIPIQIWSKQQQIAWLYNIYIIQEQLMKISNIYLIDFYKNIISTFGDFSWYMIEGNYKGQKCQIYIRWNNIKIKRQQSIIINYKNLKVYSSPFSLFLSNQQNQMFRIDFVHPFHIKQTIQIYKLLYEQIYYQTQIQIDIKTQNDLKFNNQNNTSRCLSLNK